MWHSKQLQVMFPALLKILNRAIHSVLKIALLPERTTGSFDPNFTIHAHLIDSHIIDIHILQVEETA